MPLRPQSTYDLLREHGVDRRSFLNYCVKLTAAMGLGSIAVPQVVNAFETKPRLPVIWLHGLECTCCSESFIRSSHPIAQDVILNLISLDYDDTLQAAAGEQAEEIRRKIMKDYKGQYILAVEGNAPTKWGGAACTVGGVAFADVLKETAADAKAVIAWGSCASHGCVQNAKPNPTGAEPIKKIISGKAIINVPGCPPIAEVMTGTLAYILTFDRLPELDRAGRPKMFYGQRIHDKCYRRPFSTQDNSSSPGMTTAQRKAGACTRWAAADPQRTIPAPRFAGTKARPSPSHRVTAALAAARKISGITGRSTNVSRPLPFRASIRRLTRLAKLLPC